MSLISLNKIGKVYQDGEKTFEALKEVTLTVEQGELLALVGRSGAGKSTLLHIMGCLGRPTCGLYCFEEVPIDFQQKKQLARHRNQCFGMVLQEFGLIEYRSVMENVEIPLIFNPDMKKSDMKKLCLEALECVDMSAHLHKEAWRLSGGEKQRTAIARAIVNKPKVLLADEPTGSLDYYSRNMVMNIFKQLNKAGMTIILVTHDREIAGQCKRILQLERGRLADC